MRASQKKWIAGVALATGVFVFAAAAQERRQPSPVTQSSQPKAGKSLTQAIIVKPVELKWGPGPANLPRGLQMALIAGDPKIPDRLFTLELKAPANTRIAPHYHSTDEHVTVLSGEFQVGMGEKFDRNALKSVPAGGFAALPAEHPHFAFIPVATTLQLHGAGPWTITYVNPADDPSRGVGGSGQQR